MEKEIASILDSRIVFNANIASDGAVNGVGVDCQGIQTGLMFAIAATALTDGSYALSFEEDDDVAFGAPTAVPASQIYNQPDPVTAVTANGDALAKVGVLYTKRYVRPVITASSVTTGADLIVLATESNDLAP